ncbi:ThuA domain-containing protein [Reichenbachiella sp. MALMAid0571]|uniref:ThuA domain-containing protein n=1 Tax=Reichenbachiella sp. MALMAid0571 TaxID=3143939 RepID=UPI0032DED9B4
MKNFIYLSLFLILLACSQKPKETSQETTPVSNNDNKPVQWLTFGATENNGKHIVFITGDEEYRSEEGLSQMAKIMSTRHGFKSTVLYAQEPDKPGVINPNYTRNIPGLESLKTADMVVILTRFRALPHEQMLLIDNYLKSGKPILGLRTATHAFNFGKNDSTSQWKHYGNGYNGDKEEWKGGFGRFILGEKWISHHGHHKHQSTKGFFAPGADNHPILNGIKDGEIWGSTDVYGVRLPLPGDSQPIVLGQVTNRKGEYNENDIFYGMSASDNEAATTNKKGEKLNDPMMPVAWTKSYQLPGGKKGKAFTTTLGASSDLLSESLRRMVVNGIYWAMDLPVPENADVALVGIYNPSQYGFQKDAFWIEKNMKVSDFK